MKGFLPPEILSRPKTGFGGALLDNQGANRGLFDRRFLEKIVGEQIEGRRDWSNRLWAFLFFELWFREFVDPGAR